MLQKWDWQRLAACKNCGELFFSLAKGVASRQIRDKALSICEVCPVKTECLEYAESNGEQYGIWGGKEFFPTDHVITRRHRREINRLKWEEAKQQY